MRGRLFGIIGQFGTAHRVAPLVMVEGIGPVPLVLERLSQREMQMVAVLVALRVGQRRQHPDKVVVAQPDRLQIGEAPPRVAERRRNGDGAAIRGNTFVAPPDGFQDMAIADPQPRLVLVLREDRLIGRDGGIIIAGTYKDRGLDRQMADIVRRIGDQAVGLGVRSHELALAL